MYVAKCPLCPGYEVTRHDSAAHHAHVRSFFRRTPWHVLALGVFSVLLVVLHLVAGAVAIYAYEDAPEFGPIGRGGHHVHSRHAHKHGGDAHMHPAHWITNWWLALICVEITVNGVWLASISAAWWTLDRQVGDVLWVMAHYNGLLALSTATGIICMAFWELPARSVVGATCIPGMLIPVLVCMALLRTVSTHKQYARARNVMMQDVLEPWETALLVGVRDQIP